MILVIVLVVVGPERLPKVARTLGAAWHEFARVRQEVADEVRAALPATDDLPRFPRIPSVRGTLTGLISETPSVTPSASGDQDGNGAAAPAGRVATGAFTPSADDPSMN